MKKGIRYFYLQWKRTIKIFPFLCIGILLLSGGAGLFLAHMFQINAAEESRQKVKIGIVGDITDSYLGFGIYALQNMDTSRFTVEFTDVTKEEAKKQLASGELEAYVDIPEGFVQSIMYGENKKVTYVTTGGAMGLGAALVQELADTVSELITQSQNGIYGMQRFAKAHQAASDQFWQATYDLNLKYFDLILDRSALYDIEILGIANQVSLTAYYACGLLLFLFLLWGIYGAPLLVKEDMALPKVLVAKGHGAGSQILGEYMAYYVLFCSCFFLTVLFCFIGLSYSGFLFPEWEKQGLSALWKLAVQCLPVIGMISAMQFLLYEFVSGIISGVLLQFLMAVTLGYLSGCFYPVSFFPDSVQTIASVLPSGAGLRYMTSCMRGSMQTEQLIIVMAYWAGFVCLAWLVRRKQME